MYLFDPNTKGFLMKGFHKVIPEGCIEITNEVREKYLAAQGSGKDPRISTKGKLSVREFVLTKEQIIAEISTAVSNHLNNTAREHGYTNIYTAVTYADEPSVPKFQTEGQAFRAWRSLVWDKCYQILADYEAGTISEPTPEEVIAQLPSFTL